jgi:hypothetical protein
MINKILCAIKNGNFWARVNARLRLTGRIKNKNVYEGYSRQKEYYRLEKKYKKIIEKGVDAAAGGVMPKKLWICWLQGLEEAPELVKACVASMRKPFRDWEIIVLTEENIPDYIQFPDYIVEKWKKGIISPAHYSDLLRTALLCRYGGGWVDATVLCTADEVPEYVCQAPLFVYQYLDLTRKDLEPGGISNWLIFAQRNQPILRLVQELLYAYWKDTKHLTHYFIFHLFFTMAAQRYPEEWKKVPVYNNCSPHTLRFELQEPYSKQRWRQIIQQADFHKLDRRLDFGDKEGSLYQFIIKTFGEETL